MDWKSRISADPEICHGKACIKGTRVLVSVVLDQLASGMTLAQIVQLYPQLSNDDVLAVIADAAELARERIATTSAA
ncbi:MAG: DUF433 domain-containing protein [Pseudomonadota bacterium]|jgi:uncharacterized protein (DUF433 family)